MGQFATAAGSPGSGLVVVSLMLGIDEWCCHFFFLKKTQTVSIRLFEAKRKKERERKVVLCWFQD